MSYSNKTQTQSPGVAVNMPDSSRGTLYMAGGAAALIAAALVIVEMIGFIATGSLPTTVEGWFALLQDNRLLGLVDLYLLEIVAWALFVPMFLALYKALKKANESYMIIATALAFVGIADYIATNAAFNMLYLEPPVCGRDDRCTAVSVTLGRAGRAGREPGRRLQHGAPPRVGRRPDHFRRDAEEHCFR